MKILNAPLRLFLSFLFFALALCAGGQNSAYTAYIEQYYEMAQTQMTRYGIPASITLAQGLIESGAGKSRLATKGNNHFGIKVSGNWTGPYMLQTDDAPNEKFRVYPNAAASYEDHSRHLTTNRRYADLFKLERDDYKGWARGLKRAGYATNPRYADMLIGVIEQYGLTKYDKIGKHHKRGSKSDDDGTTSQRTAGDASRRIYMCNGNYYVVAMTSDTYASIAAWSGISERRLRRYNEVPKDVRLSAGDVVFLQKKRSKASRKLKRHTYYVVKAGDSMHSISQQYGMRVKTLYKKNGLPEDAVLNVGDRLRIK